MTCSSGEKSWLFPDCGCGCKGKKQEKKSWKMFTAEFGSLDGFLHSAGRGLVAGTPFLRRDLGSV